MCFVIPTAVKRARVFISVRVRGPQWRPFWAIGVGVGRRDLLVCCCRDSQFQLKQPPVQHTMKEIFNG
jgi:hypothetical protein